MSDRLNDRVTEILNAADAESDAMLTATDGESGDDTGRDLLAVADEASDLLESTEPRELLEAVGLGTLPDGSEPNTLPEAIARGDPERVEDLHRLLRLARLADRSDGTDLDSAVGDLRATIDRARESDEESAADDTVGDDADRESANGEDDSGGNATDDLGERLRSAMSASLGDFGDEIGAIQERLEDASGAIGDDEESETGGSEADETRSDEADETEDDGGLLGSNRTDFGSSDSSRHSTMAPPPSDRADMRAVKRHSTMPKKK